MRKRRILSLGYEGRTPGELIKILLDHRVVKVLDVRELPLSRRAGFSRRALAARLEGAGIAYRHLRIAGNPHRKNGGGPERCLQLYRTYLARNPEVVAVVKGELSVQWVALLCYERKHENCHRSILLDALMRSEQWVEVFNAG